MGVSETRDINSGSPLGLGECVEARSDGKRLTADTAYPLDGVHILTESLAKQLLIEERNGERMAVGVELADGSKYLAMREVIVSAGSYRTPQLLMLSGIGPAEGLRKHDIEVLVDAPEVGRNLWDHLGTKQFWKLRCPQAGASVGSSGWKDPVYAKGNPVDWFAFHTIPQDEMAATLGEDSYTDVESASLSSSLRCHLCTYIQYVGASRAAPSIPMDGSHITTNVLVMLPTSRGSVTLASKDPRSPPDIDFNYYATTADRSRMRKGIRNLVTMMYNTPEGKDMVVSETVADGQLPLHLDSTDEEIDKRVYQKSE